MNIFFRILLAIYAFCLTILSVIVMVITFKQNIFDTISEYLKSDVLSNPTARFIVLVIAFIFLMLSLTFLLSGVRRSKDKKAVSKHTNIGDIMISLDAVENIALAASRKLSGVRETKAYIRKYEDSVSIVIKVVAMPEVNIPLLSEDIQVKVKKSVEDSTGIGVNSVRIIVENIYYGYRSRVE